MNLSKVLRVLRRIATFDAARWVEADHPRDKDGRFASRPDTGGGSGGMTSKRSGMSQKHQEIVNALTQKKPKVNETAQRKHATAADAAKATREEQASKKPGAFVHPKSYFTITMKSAHALVLNKIKSGEFSCSENFLGAPALIVHLDKVCGMAYDQFGKNKQKTTFVRVVYSKEKGYHMYPSVEEIK